MCREFLHDALIVAIAIGGVFAARDLMAQDPGAPKPAPITIPPTKVGPTPQPIEKQPGVQPPLVDPRVLRMPDLQLTLSPRSMNAAPGTFTVSNAGPVSATRASLLRVTVRILPLEGLPGLGESPERRNADQGLVLGGRLDFPFRDSSELTESEFEDLCSPPFEDFEAAIDPLDPGESQVVSQSGTSVSGGIRNVGLVGVRPATRIPTHSYIREIEVHLVCVYELRATVDANREIHELNERNEVVHTFQREVTLQ